MTVVTGAFNASGPGLKFAPPAAGPGRPSQFNLTLWGEFAAAMSLERSFDHGKTWFPLTDAKGEPVGFTRPASFTWAEVEDGVTYRMACEYLWGTAHYRLSA